MKIIRMWTMTFTILRYSFRTLLSVEIHSVIIYSQTLYTQQARQRATKPCTFLRIINRICGLDFRRWIEKDLELNFSNINHFFYSFRFCLACVEDADFCPCSNDQFERLVSWIFFNPKRNQSHLTSPQFLQNF